MLRNRNHYDCIIIGGGPAGTTLAMTLAGWGRRVAIVEEARLTPRLDFEDIGAEALPLVKRLGLMAALRHSAWKCPRRRLLLWGDGRAEELDLEATEFAMRVDRLGFDEDLRGLARGLGVEVIAPARIDGALPESGRGAITLQTPTGARKIRGSVFVVATGRRVDGRIMPLAIGREGPEATAFVAAVRGRGGRSRLDAIEALPFGFLRWQAARLPGSFGEVAVTVGRDRAQDDPMTVLVEALEGSGIGFGEIELETEAIRKLDIGSRFVTTRFPVFLVGSAAVALDPILGRGLAAAIADGEAAAVAVNTVIDRASSLAAMIAHERRRQEDRHHDELAAALGIYLREVRFSDHAFWSERHASIRVEFERACADNPVVPERLRVAAAVGRYQVYERRGQLLEATVGWGLPGGPIKRSIHRIPIEPLLGLIEKAEYTDDVLALAAREPLLFAHSRQNLLHAIFELCRLGLVEDEPEV